MPFAICSKCRYYRTHPQVHLFSPDELHMAGVLKAQTEWDQQEHERAEEELRRFQAGDRFDYEPMHYAWCWAYTNMDEQDWPAIQDAIAANDGQRIRALIEESITHGLDRLTHARDGDEAALADLAKSGRATMNPVTGDIAQIYALCQRMNPNAQCALFDPVESEAGGSSDG